MFWFFTEHNTPTPTLIQAPPRAPEPELLSYSNTTQFSNKPTIFAKTDKTHSSKLPQPIHSVSNINNTPHDISLVSDTSISNPISSQFSSPTPSKIANNPFNPPQGPISNIERLLSQIHWNHSFNIVSSPPSFRSSLPPSFYGTPLIYFLFSIFPPQATLKLSEILFIDIVYIVKIDFIPASNDIKYIRELLRLDDQYRQIVEKQSHK